MKTKSTCRVVALAAVALTLASCAAQPAAPSATSPDARTVSATQQASSQKVNPHADPYFLAFNELLPQDPHGYDGITYVAVDMSAALASNSDMFMSMLGAYCNANGFVLLPDGRAKLKDNGYIQNGVFVEGYIVAFADEQYSDNYVVTDVSIWHGDAEVVSQTYAMQATDGQWNIVEADSE